MEFNPKPKTKRFACLALRPVRGDSEARTAPDMGRPNPAIRAGSISTTIRSWSATTRDLPARPAMERLATTPKRTFARCRLDSRL